MLRASHTTGGVGSLGGRGSVRASSWSRLGRSLALPNTVPSRGRVRRSKGSAARYASVLDRMRARREARPPERPPRPRSVFGRARLLPSPCRIPARREARPPENPPAASRLAGRPTTRSRGPRGPTHPPRPPVRSSRRFPGPAGGGTPDRGPWGRRRATPGRSSGSARDRPCRHSGDATGLGSDILYAIAARTLQPGLSFDRRWYPRLSSGMMRGHSPGRRWPELGVSGGSRRKENEA